MTYQNNYNQYYNFGDQMGAMFGAPVGNDASLRYDEEERRRRQLAEQQRQQQIIQSQQTAAPATTPVTAPAPVQPSTFDRMIQAESGGRQFNAQGGVLTSPRGAQGVAQIMPSTAANPGFGVQPMSPADMADPVKNRQFGEQYFNALKQHFGGDEAKAVAAYNAGPGRVQQNIQANQGQMNVSQLPQETQRYMAQVNPEQVRQEQRQNLAQRVMEPLITNLTGTRTAQAQPRPVAPQAVAPQPVQQPAPVPQVQPQPVVQAPQQFAGIRQPQMEQQQQQADWSKQLNAAGDDYAKLSQIATDQNAPPDIQRMAMRQQALSIQQSFDEQRYRAQGQQMLESGKINEFSKLLGKDESEAGLWFKRIFGSLLGMNDVAKDASIKLGYGSTVQQVAMPDGSLAAVRFNQLGVPIEGINASGQVMSDKQLVQVAGQGFTMGRGMEAFGASFIGSDGRFYSKTNRGTFIDENGRPKPANVKIIEGYTPGTDVKLTMRNAAVREGISQIGKWYEVDPSRITRESVTDIVKRLTPVGGTFEETVKLMSEDAKEKGAKPEVIKRFNEVATQAAPAAGGAAPAAGAPTTGASLTTMKKQQEETGKDLAETQANLGKKERAAEAMLATMDDVLTHPGFQYGIGVADVNMGGVPVPIPFGSAMAGRIPATTQTDFNAKFKQLQGQQFLQAYETLKGGGQITEQEGKAATEAISALKDPNTSEKEYRRNAEILRRIVYKEINAQRKKLGLEPKYEEVTDPLKPENKEEKVKGDGSKQNPYKINL